MQQPFRRASATSFRKAITRAKKADPVHGWMVDAHTKAEYKGMRCYISRDGKSGMAIKKNGDVVSVFNTGSRRNALGKIIPFAVAAGGRKLDCFAFGSGSSLHDLYGRYGARATGKTSFSAEYAPDDYHARMNGLSAEQRRAETPHGVVAMILPSSLGGVIRAYNGSHKTPLSKIRDFSDYDDMISDRDTRLALRSQSQGIRGALGSGA